MYLSARDVTIPSDEASFTVKSYQAGAYVATFLATILVYDSRTSSVLIPHFRLSLMLFQSAHLTKKYVNEALLFGAISR